MAPEPVKKRWPWFVGGATLLLVIGVVVAGLLGLFNAPVEEAEPQAPRPVPTQTAEPTPEPLPDPTIDIPEVQHMAYTPVWNPPDEGQYFWQIVDPEHGYLETGGTSYVLAHACESQSCAGDALRLLEEGNTLTFKGELYQVQSKRMIMKTEIAEQDIWVNGPNMLVVITCIIDTTWDQSDKNEIIVARKIGG